MIAMLGIFAYQVQIHLHPTIDLMPMLVLKDFIVVQEFQNLKSVQLVCSHLQLALYKSRNVTIANLDSTVNMELLKLKSAQLVTTAL